MSKLTSGRARHTLALSFLVLTFALAGCNGGGGSNTTSHNSSAEGSPHDAETASLRWAAPATRADGSKLYVGEISGYRIYYKLRHEDNFETISVSGSDATEYPLKQFEPGIYEFAVSTLDTEGLESQRSQVIAVSVI